METPRDVVAARVREVRQKRRWTVAQLAERCAKVGAAGLTRQALYNLEATEDRQGHPRRDVSVGDLLALAAALDVAPVHLLVPIEEGGYQPTPEIALQSVSARAWIRGFKGLPGSDPRDFESEVPASELPRVQPVEPRRIFELSLRNWLERVFVHPARAAASGNRLELRFVLPDATEEE